MLHARIFQNGVDVFIYVRNFQVEAIESVVSELNAKKGFSGMKNEKIADGTKVVRVKEFPRLPLSPLEGEMLIWSL